MENDIISSINGFKVNYTCEKCSNEQEIPIFPYINFSESPEYYALVKNLDIFKCKCEKCSFENFIKFDSLIVDPIHNYFLYLFCDHKNINLFRKNVDYFVNTVLKGPELEDWNNSKTRLVLTLNDLVEKMTIFELGLNDKTIEFIKRGLIEKKLVKDINSEILFDGIYQTNLEFVSIGEKESEKINVSINFYNDIIEKVKQIDKNEQNFELIDQNWVKSKI